MSRESNIREWLRNVSRDRWLKAKVMNSMGKDWQRFNELVFKSIRDELSGSERQELRVLLNKLKAKNLDDPNIQGLKI